MSLVTVDLNPESEKFNRKQRMFFDTVMKAVSDSHRHEKVKEKLALLRPEHETYPAVYAAAEELEALMENDPYRVFFYGGSIRGGKTVICMAILCMLCVIYPRSKWHVVRKSFPVLVSNAVKALEDILMYTEGIYWKRSPSEYFVQFPNGSRIYFISESYNQDKQLTKFLGLETNGILFEQLEEIQRKSFEMIISRAGSYYKVKGPMPPPIILATFNRTYTWLKAEIRDKFVQGTLSKSYYYLEALTKDNKHVTAEQWKNFENLDDETYARLIEDKWDIEVKKAFFSGFNEEKNVSVIPLAIDYSKDIILSFDFNVDPMTATLCQTNYIDSFRVIREFRIPNSDTYAMCEAIRPFVKDREHTLVITGDASGKNRMSGTKGHINHYQIIKEAFNLPNWNQFKIPSVNPGIADSRVFCNSLLQRLRELVIDQECEWLIKDLKFLITGSNQDGDICIEKTGINEYLGIDNKEIGHLSDCFVGNTPIATSNGCRAIKYIEIGDMVMTSKGDREVIDKWDSIAYVYEFTFEDGSKIECTKDHRFFNPEYGWCPIFVAYKKQIPLCQNPLLRSNITAEFSLLNTETNTYNPEIVAGLGIADYINRFGLMLMEKFQKATQYTIRIMTDSITNLKTWNWFINQTTPAITQRSGFPMTPRTKLDFKRLELQKPMNGTRHPKELNGIDRMQSNVDSDIRNTVLQNVRSVKKNTQKNLSRHDSVRTIASLLSEENPEWITLKRHANADVNSPQINIQGLNHVAGHARLKVVTVREIGRMRVHDITVKDQPEFYANGFLVHNCLRYALHATFLDWLKIPKS